MVDQVMQLTEGKKFLLLSPLVSDRKGEHLELIKNIKSRGFVRLRINGAVYDIDDLPTIDAKKNNTMEVVVDRFSIKSEIASRLTESFETALNLSDGIATVISSEENDTAVSFSSDEITVAMPSDRLRAVSNDSVSREAISDFMENLSTTTSIVLFFFASIVGRSSISYTAPLIRKRTKPLDLMFFINSKCSPFLSLTNGESRRNFLPSVNCIT